MANITFPFGSGGGGGAVDSGNSSNMSGVVYGDGSQLLADSDITTDGSGNLTATSFNGALTSLALGTPIGNGATGFSLLYEDGTGLLAQAGSFDGTLLTVDEFSGDGGAITNVLSTNITTGTVGMAYGGGGTLAIDTDITTDGSGALTAVSFHGDGSGLINLGGNVSQFANDVGYIKTSDTIPMSSVDGGGAGLVYSVNGGTPLQVDGGITTNGSGSLTAATLNAGNGFSSVNGIFTTFTFVNGICTAAS